MAERRMFAKSVIDSDMFLDMSLSTQALYFHLAMRADDDGFINNPKRIQRMIGASDDEMKILIAKQYIFPFESGVVVIRHWKIHNYIQKDRYHPSDCPEKQLVKVEKNKVYELLDTECIQDGNIGKVRLGKVRLGKVRLGKVRLGKVRLGKVRLGKSNNAHTRDEDCQPEPPEVCTTESTDDCSPALAETLKAFEEHRKKMRKPMTDYAKKLLLKKLEKLASDEEGKIAILNQSIENGWQGIFPLKGADNANESSAEMAERVKRKLRERGFLNDGAGENNGHGDANSRPSWFS